MELNVSKQTKLVTLLIFKFLDINLNNWNKHKKDKNSVCNPKDKACRAQAMLQKLKNAKTAFSTTRKNQTVKSQSKARTDKCDPMDKLCILKSVWIPGKESLNLNASKNKKLKNNAPNASQCNLSILLC
jgi:hypothetical protein